MKSFKNVQPFQIFEKSCCMNEWFSYMIIAGVFLGGMVPLVAGIVHCIKENKALDDSNKKRP